MMAGDRLEMVPQQEEGMALVETDISLTPPAAGAVKS